MTRVHLVVSGGYQGDWPDFHEAFTDKDVADKLANSIYDATVIEIDIDPNPLLKTIKEMVDSYAVTFLTTGEFVMCEMTDIGSEERAYKSQTNHLGPHDRSLLEGEQRVWRDGQSFEYFRFIVSAKTREEAIEKATDRLHGKIYKFISDYAVQRDRREDLTGEQQ